MVTALVFWIIFGVVAFALALALQMRFIVAKVLRMAAKAKFPSVADADLVTVVKAMPDHTGALLPALSEVSQHIQTAHDGAVGHLVLARRGCMILPVVLLAVVLAGRFVLGVI